MSDKRIILPVRGGGDYTETDACFLEFDEALVKRSLARIALARSAKADDSDFVELCFWDGSPMFFPSEVLHHGLQDRLFDGEIVDAPSGVTESSIPAVRVECVQMRVMDDRVYWTCYLKHTDVRLETEAVRFDFLKDLAG